MKLGSFCKVSFLLAYTLGSAQVFAQASQSSSANVSGATSNYQLLLEIRGLQREVAELRDRIDQQEFQLEQMRQNKVTNSSVGSVSELPKKVQQFDEGGAVVEEIDLSSVAGGNSVDQAVNNQPNSEVADLSASTPELGRDRVTSDPFFSTKPTLPTNEAAPVSGGPGGVFGPLSNSGLPSTTAETEVVAEQPSTSKPSVVPNIVPNTAPESSTLLPEDRFGGIGSEIRSEPLVNNNEAQIAVDNAQTAIESPLVTQPPFDAATQAVPEQPSSTSTLLESGDFGIKTTIGEEELYANGLSELKQQRYEKAVTVLSSQLAQYPKGSRAPDAYYWIGESLYIMERLESAKKSYMSILNLFPDNRRVPNAIYKVAVIEFEQGNTPAAKAAVETLKTKYPSSSAAQQAKTRFAGIL